MAISRKKVDIYIANADTALSDLTATDKIEGQIINYSQSGGSSDLETVHAFGGDIDKEKSREQVEVSMEIVPNLSSATNSVLWESMFLSQDVSADTTGADSTIAYTLADSGTNVTLPSDKLIALEALAGTVYQSTAFNNCNVTQFEVSHDADDNRSINITFKFSPITTTGVSNLLVVKTDLANCTDFSQLSNN